MGFIKKVCLLGDPAVGKTSLIQRFVYNKFSENYLSTIGTTPSVYVMDHHGVEVTLTIWDIAGQESFQNIHSSYFKGASGAILVCDITRRATIENLTHWSHRFNSVMEDAPFILVSNKWDLVKDDKDMLDREKEIITYSEQAGCDYIRASAKQNENVSEMFIKLLESLMNVEN